MLLRVTPGCSTYTGSMGNTWLVFPGLALKRGILTYKWLSTKATSKRTLLYTFKSKDYLLEILASGGVKKKQKLSS